MENVSRQLIDYTVELSRAELDDAVIHQAKRRLIDTLGCAIGGYTATPVKLSRKMAPRISEGPVSRIFGSHQPTTPEMAAFVNGVMIRYLDYNDTYRTVDGAHPSDNVSAILAVAEAFGCSGEEFLMAMMVVYEIQCRFVDCVALNAKGWDMPVSGAIASALACGRLMRLDRDQLFNAMSIAATSNICTYQCRAGQLSMWKGAAAANGARQGVFAAMLAREGMTGPSDPFTGQYGIWPLLMGGDQTLTGLARKGGKFGVMQSNIKQYPVKDSLQVPAAAGIALHGEAAPDDIAEIHVETYQSAYNGAAADPEFWTPRTRETADHSMPFCVCIGLLDGTITPQTFIAERYLDDDIKAAMAKCRITVLPEFSKAAPGIRHCRVTIKTKSGKSVDALRKLSRTDIEAGLTDAELLQKFRRLTGEMLSVPDQERLLSAIARVETMKNISELVDATAI